MIVFFFFNDTATTEIYTLSLHDALPICGGDRPRVHARRALGGMRRPRPERRNRAAEDCRPDPPDPDRSGRRLPVQPCPDRKSTRLNSSHANISYAVFCLKKKKKT